MTIGAPRKATPCTVLVQVSRVKTLAMRHSPPNVFRLLIGGRLELAILLGADTAGRGERLHAAGALPFGWTVPIIRSVKRACSVRLRCV